MDVLLILGFVIASIMAMCGVYEECSSVDGFKLPQVTQIILCWLGVSFLLLIIGASVGGTAKQTVAYESKRIKNLMGEVVVDSTVMLNGTSVPVAESSRTHTVITSCVITIESNYRGFVVVGSTSSTVVLEVNCKDITPELYAIHLRPLLITVEPILDQLGL